MSTKTKTQTFSSFFGVDVPADECHQSLGSLEALGELLGGGLYVAPEAPSCPVCGPDGLVLVPAGEIAWPATARCPGCDERVEVEYLYDGFVD